MYITRGKSQQKHDPLTAEKDVIIGDIVTRKLYFMNKELESILFKQNDCIILAKDSMITLHSDFFEEVYHSDKHTALVKMFTLSFEKNGISVCEKSTHAFVLKKIAPNDCLLLLVQDRHAHNSETVSPVTGYNIHIDEKQIYFTEKKYTIDHTKTVTHTSKLFDHVPQLRYLDRLIH